MSFKLIVITPESNHPKEIKLVISLFKNGLQLLHVRKPNFTETELNAYLQQIPKKFYKRIVIHSHYKLANEFNLKGIHLTEQARKGKHISSSYKIISTSFHNTADILRSRRKYEHVFLSPIYNSISKKGYTSNFDLEELRPFSQKHKNIIALGGITTQNIKTIQQAGFFGAAVIGSFWQSKNPEKSYKELLSKIK